MIRYNRKCLRTHRYFNIEPDGTLILIAKSNKPLSNKLLSKIFKRLGY